MKKKTIIISIIILFTVIIITALSFLYIKNKAIIKEEEKKEALIIEITNKYNKYVITNKNANIYELINNKYIEIGQISKSVELELESIDININTKYFVITNLDNKYYISYKDVDKTDKINDIKDIRYKNYIPYNQNIITKDKTKFYKNIKLIYQVNKSFNLPIIIKENESYYVIHNDKLMEVKKEDVAEVVENNNTELSNAKNIPVITYHAIYDPNGTGDKCYNIICHPIAQFDSHMKYLKENNFFTPTMREFEMYLDYKLQLPSKSVLITIDDGTLANLGIDILEKYELNNTLFLITAWFNKEEFKTTYGEIHSHGHNLHNTGVCPGGQGGGIKCLPKEVILEDLKQSRNILDQTTVFCYPFYEYNNYAIDLVKEAGFTMAFIGGNRRVTLGIDKMKIPRYTIVATTTLGDFKKIVDSK